MADIETMTTDEIVDELAKRNACVVVAIAGDLNPQAETRCVWYRGGLVRSLGLTRIAQIWIEADLNKRKDIPHDDHENRGQGNDT